MAINNFLNILTQIKGRVRTLYYLSKIGHCGHKIKFGKVELLKGGSYITIGKYTSFQNYLFLTAWDRYMGQSFLPSITIGSNCDFGAFNHITCINKIVIGSGVLTGKWVTITDNNHGGTSMKEMKISPQNRNLISKGEIHIGNNVFIGDKATILSGVTIGDGAIIGANSVVTNDIPSFCVACGNPAKVIKNNNLENNGES